MRARVSSPLGMRMVTVSDAPGRLVWLSRRIVPFLWAACRRAVRASGWASHQAASSCSLVKVGIGGMVSWFIGLSFLMDLQLLQSHRVSSDEADSLLPNG